MAEKNTPKDTPGTPLSEENEVLKPPPRRKKSMKKSKMEAEKARQKQHDKSAIDSVNSAKLGANYQDEENLERTRTVNAYGSVDRSKETYQMPLDQIQTNNNIEPAIDSECEKLNSVEPKPTNDMQIDDSKVEKQPVCSTENKMVTSEQPLSFGDKQNIPPQLESDLKESSQMGNKTPKLNSPNAAKVPDEKDSQVCSNQSQSNNAANKDEEVTDSGVLDSFYWVVDVNSPSSSHVSTENTSQDNPDEGAKQPYVLKESDGNKAASQQAESALKDNISTSYAKEHSGSLDKSADLTESILTTSSQSNSSVCEEISKQCKSGNTTENVPKDTTNVSISESSSKPSPSETNNAEIIDISKETQSESKSLNKPEVDCVIEKKQSGISDNSSKPLLSETKNAEGKDISKEIQSESMGSNKLDVNCVIENNKTGISDNSNKPSFPETKNAEGKNIPKEIQSKSKCSNKSDVECAIENKKSGDSDTHSTIDCESNTVHVNQKLDDSNVNRNTDDCTLDNKPVTAKIDDHTEKSSSLQSNLIVKDEMHPTMKGESLLKNNSPLLVTDTNQQNNYTDTTNENGSNQEKSIPTKSNSIMPGKEESDKRSESDSMKTPSGAEHSDKEAQTNTEQMHSLPSQSEGKVTDATSLARVEKINNAKTKSKSTSSNKGRQPPRKGSNPYQHLGDSLSSVEEYELWENENLSSGSDSDTFYSDGYSSSEGEGEYHLEHREKMWGTHNIDQGDSLPKSPLGENTISEILSVFPNTEYLSLAEGKDSGSHGDGNHDGHGNNTQVENNSDDFNLSQDRAESLKRKIGSFKVVAKADPKVDTDVVKVADVAIPTELCTQTTSASTNADEAEKAIQALHKNYMKHVHREIKSKPRKSPEKEGESTVYFSRVATVQQDSGKSFKEKKLEISRPRSIQGEPRLRSLSTGDLSKLQLRNRGKHSTLPVRARSWKNDNDDRLFDLGGELKTIIGSLDHLEISRDRRDSGSPLYKNFQDKGAVLEKVSELESNATTDGSKDFSKLGQNEDKSDDVFEDATRENQKVEKLPPANLDLTSPSIPRTLSVVKEESVSLTKSNRTSTAVTEGKPKDDQQKEGEVKVGKSYPLGATPVNKRDTLVRFKDEVDAPLCESTPKRPKSLDLTTLIALEESYMDFSPQNEEYKLDTSTKYGRSNTNSAKKKNGSGDVETRKIKMVKGRRPFSSVEPGNIPTSPTDACVELTSFHSTRDADALDAGFPDYKADRDVSGEVEEAIEAAEETTPTRPPRKKPPLDNSSSFSSREKPAVKRVKNNKNRPEKSFRKTLSDADWLKVRLSVAKPSLELSHDGPVTLVTDAIPASVPSFPTHKRAQIALELYTTERTFVRGLETVIELFKNPLEGYLDSKELEAMFSNINAIFTLNKDVLFSLCERVTHWSDDQMIGDIFVDMAPRFKIYATYCTNYDAAENLIKQKIKRKKDFETFLNTCYNDPICQPGLTLQAYLITVVQRIPRYLLLLRDLNKCTSSDHVDNKTIKEGLQKMNNIAEYINNQLQAVQGQRAMTELRSRVIGIKAFETPGRSLIKEGEVYVMSTKKTYKCLLFNDMIVFAAKNVNKHSEVELTLELKTLWVCDLEDNDPQTMKEDAIELYTPERSYTMYAGSRNEKKLWLQKLKTAIAIQLHGEEATANSTEISSRKAAFTFKDGKIYCGCFVDCKTHGHGVLAWPNRTRYVGNFEDGERNGIGELTYNTGEKYNGQWVDDKQHGIGKLTYPNGDFYCGEWKEGRMHGKGLITFSNKDKIEGEFVDSEVCGSAKMYCIDNLKYDGTWKHSKKHGKGKLTKPNGDTYEGEFQNDRIHGEGTMVYAKTKAKYKGQWENNQRHGVGSYSIPNGTCYDGEWSSDHIQGRGKMVYSNGEVYEGSWFRDMRFGKGLFKSHEGIYDGHFEYNLRHKFGVIEYNDGSKYEGEWQNDQREGQGTMVYPDLGIYEGSWFHNLRHGRGKMTSPNGATYEGSWDLDSPHGSEGLYLDQDSLYSYVGEWVHGRKEGRGLERTINGTYEGDFKANVRHGRGIETLKGGIVFEGKWRDNRKVGEGQRRTRWGSTETTEIQQWKEGQLMNKDESVAPDLPFLQRH